MVASPDYTFEILKAFNAKSLRRLTVETLSFFTKPSVP
jgi:hypothetical protein